uniref:Putative disease resistance protein At1g59620 n=1 Tax=Anthurium amnicola TaxID=1678845 RepID=A0A1D1XP08_9ARAE
MDALQVIASASQIVSAMVGAVSALEQASRDLDEAPRRIRNLEEYVSDLETLMRCLKQRHSHKLHNPRLERQLQSLSGLIERLRPNIGKARRITSKSKMRNVAKVVWFSVTGDPLSRLINSIRADLMWWLESQKISENVEQIVESTADSVPSLLRINVDQGYPVSNKCHYIQQLLEEENSHKVVLIVGLSGIGKSCLARQVASNTPKKFIHGAVELHFGEWCSRAACNGSAAEYHKRLAKKICRLLVQIGCMKTTNEGMNMDLEDVCCMLQTALVGKSILVLLDDVWEQDIVERFTKLYDNDCRYLVTTRNEGVYEITEAEKVEICKDDIKEISKEILLYHSLLTNEELPSIAEALLDRCGHHPLTVAVMGKALRKEFRTEKWEKAIGNLSTYATCEPGPVSYRNEKESENTSTIFGSFEFSLQAMPEHSQSLFVILASVSWAEPVPEICLEVLWSALGHDSIFPLVVCKLVEGSLLIKTDTDTGYHVHDMVALYLDSKTSNAIELLIGCSNEVAAAVAPWLFVFGKDRVKIVAEEKMKSLISLSHERQAVIALESIVQALMASKSISELEASRKSFSSIVGPKVAEFISAGSPSIIAASAKLTTILFTKEDYCEHALENTEAVDKLLELLRNCNDPPTQTSIFALVGKLSEHGSSRTISKVLSTIPMNRLVDLLSPSDDKWHDCVFMAIMSLTKAGKSEAVQMMVASGVDKSLIGLLENGSEVAQHHAIVILKAFYEMGGSLGYLQHGTLNLLPWHARLSLERFVLSDRSTFLSPKLQTFEDLIHNILGGDSKHVLGAMQDLIPIIEKAGDPRIREMILQSPLIERLAFLLKFVNTEQSSVRSEAAFLLMKLACSGGELFIRKFLEYDIVLELVKMMQCHVAELQDSAYTALHQMVFGAGGTLVLNQILKVGLLEKLAHSLDGKFIKSKEVSMHFILDLVEMGSKPCIERMFSLQVVEKLACLQKAGGCFSGVLVNFLKGLDKCKNLSAPERRVMKQQVVRKVRASMKGHKLESSIIAEVENCISEGSWGSSSSKSKN